jgi:hypothetical protein
MFSGPEDPFYLAPRTIPLHDSRSTRWFLKQKVGEKKLSSIVKTVCRIHISVAQNIGYFTLFIFGDCRIVID